jgi:hypothetical protein
MYIIDGYNLLWAIPKIDSDWGDITDVQLCRLISRYLRVVRQPGEVIFDGIGPPDKTPFYSTVGVDIVFSGANTDADSIIEARLKDDSAPKRLTIVSSDRRIRNAAKSRKAVSIKSEQFWLEMVNLLNRRSSEVEPGEKRDGLDQAQTKQWLEYFGLDQ